MEQLDDHIIVQCIKLGSKLKLKILTANIPINERLYCSGNKAVRQEGAIYKVKGAVKLIQSTTPFYKLSNKATDYTLIKQESKEISTQDLEALGIEIFAQPVCCACLDGESTVFLLPCRHEVLCIACFDMINAGTRKCPMCRSNISDYKIVKDGE